MKIKIFIEFCLFDTKYETLENYGVDQVSIQIITALKVFSEITFVGNNGLWLDVGNQFKCTCGGSNFIIFLAKYSLEDSWEVTIEREKYPSFFRGLFERNDDEACTNFKKVTKYLYSGILNSLSPMMINISMSSEPQRLVTDPQELNWS